MAEWQGYILLKLTPPALTTPQLVTIKAALRAIATSDSPFNDRILEIRPNLAKSEAIVKSYWPNGLPSKAAAVHAIAQALGVSDATINSRLTFSVFAVDNARDIYGGEGTANDYIQANIAAWETPL